MKPLIRGIAVLEHIIIDILEKNPEGVTPRFVYDYLLQNHSIPKEWFRPLGRGTTPTATEPDWQNKTRWVKDSLRKKGFLDPRPVRGLWKIGPHHLRRVSLPVLTEEERKLTVGKAEKTERDLLLQELSTNGGDSSTHGLRLLVEISRDVRRMEPLR